MRDVEEKDRDNRKSATGGLGFNSFIGALIISLTLVLVIGGLVYYVVYHNSFSVVYPQIDPNAHEYLEEGSEPAEPGRMSISGYSQAIIPAYKTNVPLLLSNPENNKDKVYFSYDLVLDDTGEVLYSSKMVPAGQAITNINLKRPLPPGVYNATVVWKSYLIDQNFAEGNTVDMKLELKAE